MTNKHSDIRLDGFWGYFPPRTHPYITVMRLDRPIGWWLLLLPGWWSILAGAPSWQSALVMMLLFLIGAIAMRGAGCVINDLWDRDIDQKVARTSGRPLASGALSIGQALLLLFGLGIIGLIILLQLPMKAWGMGVMALPLVATYPLFKRFTYWPQAMLGLTFSWGILLGHVAITDSWPSSAVLLLYVGAVFWVIGYDTIYAIQDMADDKLSGVKSSALALEGRISQAVACLYSLSLACLYFGLWEIYGASAWLFGFGAMALHLCWQVTQISETDRTRALRLFQSNRNAGLLLTAGLLVELFV